MRIGRIGVRDVPCAEFPACCVKPARGARVGPADEVLSAEPARLIAESNRNLRVSDVTLWVSVEL